jgi:class 3 adenylate cyclase
MEVSMSLTLTFMLAGVTVVMAIINYTMETFIRKRFLLMQNVEQERVKIETEKRISQGLLLNIFPKVIIEKFKRDKATIVEEFSDVTIFYSDIVSFTAASSNLPPIHLVNLLNDMFTRFDEIVGKYKLEKIKTIGTHHVLCLLLILCYR